MRFIGKSLGIRNAVYMGLRKAIYIGLLRPAAQESQVRRSLGRLLGSIMPCDWNINFVCCIVTTKRVGRMGTICHILKQLLSTIISSRKAMG